MIEAREGGEDATLAFDVFIHRIRRDVAAMTASARGLDLLVFTGGIGEHEPEVRTLVAEGLSYLGVVLDEGANQVPRRTVTSVQPGPRRALWWSLNLPGPHGQIHPCI